MSCQSLSSTKSTISERNRSCSNNAINSCSDYLNVLLERCNATSELTDELNREKADVQNLKKEVERLADHNKKLNIFVNQVKYAYEATPTIKSIKDISSKAENALNRIEKGLNELEWKKCSPPPQLIIGDHVDDITRIVDEVIEKIEKYCQLIRPLNEAFAGKMKTLQDMRADSIRVRKELVEMRSRVNKLETILATTHLLEDSALSNDFK